MDNVTKDIILKKQQEIEKLEHENKMLKNRCVALTLGQMCLFCPYECEHRTAKYRGQADG